MVYYKWFLIFNLNTKILIIISKVSKYEVMIEKYKMTNFRTLLIYIRNLTYMFKKKLNVFYDKIII